MSLNLDDFKIPAKYLDFTELRLIQHHFDDDKIAIFNELYPKLTENIQIVMVYSMFLFISALISNPIKQLLELTSGTKTISNKEQRELLDIYKKINKTSHNFFLKYNKILDNSEYKNMFLNNLKNIVAGNFLIKNGDTIPTELVDFLSDHFSRNIEYFKLLPTSFQSVSMFPFLITNSLLYSYYFNSEKDNYLFYFVNELNELNNNKFNVYKMQLFLADEINNIKYENYDFVYPVKYVVDIISNNVNKYILIDNFELKKLSVLSDKLLLTFYENKFALVKTKTIYQEHLFDLIKQTNNNYKKYVRIFSRKEINSFKNIINILKTTTIQKTLDLLPNNINQYKLIVDKFSLKTFNNTLYPKYFRCGNLAQYTNDCKNVVSIYFAIYGIMLLKYSILIKNTTLVTKLTSLIQTYLSNIYDLTKVESLLQKFVSDK